MQPNPVRPKEEQGRWVFYDVDLDAVRAELAQDVFLAGRLEPKEFKERQEFKKMLEEHIQRTQNRKPEAGDYDAQPVQENIPGPLFDKMQERFQAVKNYDDDLEGDVLILDPEKLGKRLPGVQFDKMLGRNELAPVNEEDELILDP
jgi:hypothetical protein